MFARHDTPREGRRSRLSIALVVLILVALGVLGATSGVAAAKPQAAGMWLGASSPVRTDKSLSVSGGITAAADLSGETVRIYKREMGKNSDTLVAQATVTTAPWGNVFQATLAGLKHSAILTAKWAGNADYSPCRYWIFVPVRAKVTLTAPQVTANHLKLRATITPAQPQDEPAFLTAKDFLILFQRKVDGKWTYMGMGDTASSDGKSWVTGTSYDPDPGDYVLRARFVGTDYNAPARLQDAECHGAVSAATGRTEQTSRPAFSSPLRRRNASR